jgi:transcriptional antiterminator RfaH
LEPLWYVATTKPNEETKARDWLLDYGLNVRLLRYKGQRIMAGRRVTCLKPLLPGYLFVELDIRVQQWGFIANTYGCTGMIMRGDVPAALTEDEAKTVFSRCDSKDIVEDIRLPYRRKATLKLIDGPESMRDLSVIFDEPDERNRIWILLNVLGAVRRISVPAVWCEAV